MNPGLTHLLLSMLNLLMTLNVIVGLFTEGEMYSGDVDEFANWCHDTSFKT